MAAIRPPANGEVAHALAVVVDDRAALEDQVVALGHRASIPIPIRALERPTAAAYVPLATRGNMNRMKAALLPDRGVVKVVGDDARGFLNGLLTADIAKVTPAAAEVRRAADAAGQDHRRLHRRGGAGRGRRRLLPRLPARARGRAGGEAQLLQAARQGDLRGPVGGAGRDGGLGRHRAHRIRPGLSRSAPAGARPARDAAAASRQGGGGRSRRRAGRRVRLRGASHRARRAARRARFHLWRRLPARDRHGPARRRRFRQGLLRRPGGGVAHGASRHRAQPHRAGRPPTALRPTPACR